MACRGIEDDGNVSRGDPRPVQLADRTRPRNPLSYPQSERPFDYQLFRNPSREYRGCPFWAWNCKLDKAVLEREARVFKEMGFGGFHMHARVGLDTNYMGEDFMDLVKYFADWAEKEEMMACLYDEDRWPSGTKGGKMIKKYPEHRKKVLRFTPVRQPILNGPPDFQTPERSFLASYAIELDAQGFLVSSRRLKPDERAENVWYAYVETPGSEAWFNGAAYVDVMSKEALGRFIEMTHEAYKEKVGDKFGMTVPCIFTDEPQLSIKGRLSNPWDRGDVTLPWTHDLPASFQAVYGKTADLIKDIPNLIWDSKSAPPTRYRYHEHTCERFVTSFMDQISAWCGENNIMLDGHMMDEPTLASQTGALGEAMRCYRSMQMPGMDLLADVVEYNTAKQVTSVARQRGLRGAMCEIYGCTHWDFTFEGHKGCGDWHAALGITFRVHHLAWASMKGESKRDYPASINYQSPWWKKYSYVENHFARVAVAMTRGQAITRVGVIHPIESFWIECGPRDGRTNASNQLDVRFSDLTNWLLHGLIDFDFISERLLPDQFGGIDESHLRVGECKYRVVLVPHLCTIRKSTLNILLKFMESGGQVIVAGAEPKMVEGMSVPAEWLRPTKHLQTTKVEWKESAIMDALEKYRELDVRISTKNSGTETSARASKVLYQMRQDGEERFLFICNTDRVNSVDGDGGPPSIKIKGRWQVELLDTITGKANSIESPISVCSDWTTFTHSLPGCGSLLLRLRPLIGTLNGVFGEQPVQTRQLRGQVSLHNVSLDEPNVLLLDYACYQVNGGPVRGPQEILQIDNDIRRELGMPWKSGVGAQPWTVSESSREPVAEVAVHFQFKCDIEFYAGNAWLAIEPQLGMTVLLNGTVCYKHTTESTGTEHDWWVDQSIAKIRLPERVIRMGLNDLTLLFPFGVLTNVERVYILGDFGVYVKDPSHSYRTGIYSLGDRPVSLQDNAPLTWGDITKQGFPFYVGNVTYNISLSLPAAGKAAIWVPQFSTPVVGVQGEDGKGEAVDTVIAFRPRRAEVGDLSKDESVTWKLVCYGNRLNSFGHLHLPGNSRECWPDAWRSKFFAWTDDYNVKPVGILEEPYVEVTQVFG